MPPTPLETATPKGSLGEAPAFGENAGTIAPPMSVSPTTSTKKPKKR